MALRLFCKINSTFNSNLTQVFHPNRSLVKSVAVCINNDKAENEKSSNDDENSPTHLLHENIKHKTFDVRERSQLSFPDLQPSLLPEYYNPHKNFDNPLKYIEKPVVESAKQSASQRVFEASTTYKNVKLPLKPPRLAKPFPDPVKMMASDTISDDEKARQMQSDAQYPGNSKSKNVNKMNFNPQYRSFGTKCHHSKNKRKKRKKKKCQRIKSRNCPHARSHCARSFKFKRCRKQKAPYPSYSEICHTVLDSYPSECQMCPWTPQNHPTFKIKKRKYHTSAITFRPNEQDFEKWLHSVDQNRGWVREKKTLQKLEKNNHKRKSSETNKNIEIPKLTNQFKLHHRENFSNKSKNKKSNVEIEPIIPSTSNMISSKPLFLYPGIKTEKNEAIEIKSLKNNGKRRSKSEMLPAVKHKSKAKTVLYNPEKKEKKFDQNWNKEDIPSTINITINYFLAKKKDRRFPPGTRDKCPDVDPEADDPCKLKRPGKTRECPKDLLIKKRRPIKPPGKKKCYPKNPEKPNNPDQPYF